GLAFAKARCAAGAGPRAVCWLARQYEGGRVVLARLHCCLRRGGAVSCTPETGLAQRTTIVARGRLSRCVRRIRRHVDTPELVALRIAARPVRDVSLRDPAV